MISHFEEVVSNSSRVLDAAKIMSLPCLATEQYPKGLGPTVEELGLAKHSITAFPKTCFTMVIPELLEALKTQQEETKCVSLFFKKVFKSKNMPKITTFGFYFNDFLFKLRQINSQTLRRL